MSLRARLAALFFGVSAPARPAHRERVTSTISDDRISPARERQLIEVGRRAVIDRLSATHVERDGHFDVPRFTA